MAREWTDEIPLSGKRHLNGARSVARPVADGRHGEQPTRERSMALPVSPAVPTPRTIHVAAGVTLRSIERRQVMAVRPPRLFHVGAYGVLLSIERCRVMAVRHARPGRRRVARRWESHAAGWAFVAAVLLAGAIAGISLALGIALALGWMQ